MTTVTTIDFTAKKDNLEVLITTKKEEIRLDISYFGIIDGFEEFISFWDNLESFPIKMINKEHILEISIVDNDNSKNT